MILITQRRGTNDEEVLRDVTVTPAEGCAEINYKIQVSGSGEK